MDVAHDPVAWSAAPEWRRTEARFWTPPQRACLRSWGVSILEPPAETLSRHLRTSQLQLGCVKAGCPQPSAPDSNYCVTHAPRRARISSVTIELSCRRCGHEHAASGCTHEDYNGLCACGVVKRDPMCGACDHAHPEGAACDYVDGMVGHCACPARGGESA